MKSNFINFDNNIEYIDVMNEIDYQTIQNYLHSYSYELIYFIKSKHGNCEYIGAICMDKGEQEIYYDTGKPDSELLNVDELRSIANLLEKFQKGEIE